jgi:hypothetical protein
MSRTLRRLAVVPVTALSLACASSGGSKPNARVREPELLTRTRPELVMTRVTPNSARPTTVVEIEVQVRPDGSADVSTLKVTGVGASENRAAVTTWVQGLRFKPATQDGIPVVGTYRQSFDVMTRVRVVR